MSDGPATPGTGDDPTRIFDGAFRLVVILAAALVVLMVVRVLGDAVAPRAEAGPDASAATGVTSSASPGATGTPVASIDVDAYLEDFVRPAPDLELTGADGRPLSLAALRGTPVLVFFGYTHCPDVCPVTIGAVGEAIAAAGGDARAVFVSVDPERDTIPWLGEFVRYMPSGFTAATGTPAEVRATADAWGVRYARVEEADPANYSMSHTADVFVIDGAGQFRARLPFGTEVPTMTAVLREVAATTAVVPTAAPAASASPIASAAAASLLPEVISSSVWSGGASPVIFALNDAGGQIDDPALTVTAQLVGSDGSVVGTPAIAVAVQPIGISDVSFVATLDIPAPGSWKVDVTASDAAGVSRQGEMDITALDPGGTAALGAPAPTIRTPTAADFGGDLTWVTTDPLPDPRMSTTSTVDALAAGTPFVLVVDSIQFRVTPACGKAVVMAKRLLDRWRDVPFIHHEPYRYTVITTEPVLEGTLTAPVLTEPAVAWGVGADPWGVGSMPWIFIVDGDGIVRAKYQGVMGSADVDVLLSMLAAQG
jgi:protein SCO1/2